MSDETPTDSGSSLERAGVPGEAWSQRAGFTSLPNSQQPPLVRFGDALIYQHWLVTPQGTRPLPGTQVFVNDMTRTERYLPVWAIVVAILGAWFFLLSLLLLFVRSERQLGFVQITLTNGPFTYQTAEPPTGDFGSQLFELQNRANYARGVILRAGS